eukprot:TRINITY_DN26193_c0_g1_i1.p1 TRINITY_DN26193_c0_g1~~TRINITY_DN26193_c0_g1_i1.p1  ORF type:complete len:568 (-),score=60.93 TRINITY_DN26193_c0_g1_i1:355-2058(-)
MGVVDVASAAGLVIQSVGAVCLVAVLLRKRASEARRICDDFLELWRGSKHETWIELQVEEQLKDYRGRYCVGLCLTLTLSMSCYQLFVATYLAAGYKGGGSGIWLTSFVVQGAQCLGVVAGFSGTCRNIVFSLVYAMMCAQQFAFISDSEYYLGSFIMVFICIVYLPIADDLRLCIPAVVACHVVRLGAISMYQEDLRAHTSVDEAVYLNMFTMILCGVSMLTMIVLRCSLDASCRFVLRLSYTHMTTTAKLRSMSTVMTGVSDCLICLSPELPILSDEANKLAGLLSQGCDKMLGMINQEFLNFVLDADVPRLLEFLAGQSKLDESSGLVVSSLHFSMQRTSGSPVRVQAYCAPVQLGLMGAMSMLSIQAVGADEPPLPAALEDDISSMVPRSALVAASCPSMASYSCKEVKTQALPEQVVVELDVTPEAVKVLTCSIAFGDEKGYPDLLRCAPASEVFSLRSILDSVQPGIWSTGETVSLDLPFLSVVHSGEVSTFLAQEHADLLPRKLKLLLDDPVSELEENKERRRKRKQVQQARVGPLFQDTASSCSADARPCATRLGKASL